MDLGLTGKRAVVMGGGGCIGRGIADALAAEGVKVALVSRHQEALDQAASEIRAAGGTALGAAADLADHASIAAAFSRIEAEWGGVDILINNSGGPPPS